LNGEGKNYHTPRTNTVPAEWTHNFLIPLALGEFYRKGRNIFIVLLIFTLLCSGVRWAAAFIQADYEQSISWLQNETAGTLAKYAKLKGLSDEFSELGNWKNDPDPGTQYSALSSLLVRNGCFLVQSVFHSGLPDLPDKTREELRGEVERTRRSRIDDLRTAGIWTLSLRLPVAGIGTAEARKNIITALQKEAAESLKPAEALLVLTEEQGQNTLNLLRNENSVNAILYVWK
jgi:hypothetical protein